jgi:hypothetical protein
MIDTAVMDRVQLINGQFTPSQAADLISALIQEKINFHKLHRLAMCEGDIHSDTGADDSCIARLERELADFKALAREARAAGKQMRISCSLDVELTD